MKKSTYSSLMIACALSLAVASCQNNSNPQPDNGPYFASVKNIIANNCLSCHSSTGTWQGRPTKFDTDDDIVALAGSIKAAVADPVTITNKRMPQGGQLSTGDINTIVKWFNKGGKATD